MTPAQIMGSVEFADDRALAAIEDEEFLATQRIKCIVKRAFEINTLRVAALSIEDMQLAFEHLSTMPKSMERVRELILSKEEWMYASLMGMIDAALLTDSIRDATREIDEAAKDKADAGDFH